jgi:DNA-binding protein YbaB
MDRLGRLLDELPRRMEEARETAAEFATGRFDATTTDDSVTATVDGAGRLVELAVTPIAARRLDNLTLSDRIAEAVNAALDATDRARDALLGPAGAAADLTAAEQVFDYRMGELHRTLDGVEARLRDLGP